MEPMCVLEGWASKKGQLERPPVAVSSSSSAGNCSVQTHDQKGPGSLPSSANGADPVEGEPRTSGGPPDAGSTAQPSPSTPGGSLGPD